MGWVFSVIVGTLGVILLWGLVSPRTQWRALAGWSISDVHRNEPGGGSYGLRRLLSGIGLLGVVAVLTFTGMDSWVARPAPASALSSVEQRWGTPEPHLIDRVVTAQAAAPEGLTPVPVGSYENLDNGAPAYLFSLQAYSRLGDSAPAGIIGVFPGDGYTATGSAEMVVQASGPLMCIPRVATVIESETTVQIGLFYGLPDSADGAAVDHLAGCAADAPITESVLLPIELAAPLGERAVQSLDGTAIESVPLVD